MNEAQLSSGGVGSVKTCPWCAESIRAEAVKCRHCGSVVENGRGLEALARPWLRPLDGRMLAGVCAGLADQFGISVTLVRFAFALGFVFSGGLFLFLYLIAWISMPSEQPRLSGQREDLGG